MTCWRKRTKRAEKKYWKPNVVHPESLKKVNMTMWEIEDKVRICEKNKDFSEKFIELARGVYFNNDKRSRIKLEINKKLNSNITEVKEYVDYEN